MTTTMTAIDLDPLVAQPKYTKDPSLVNVQLIMQDGWISPAWPLRSTNAMIGIRAKVDGTSSPVKAPRSPGRYEPATPRASRRNDDHTDSLFLVRSLKSSPSSFAGVQDLGTLQQLPRPPQDGDLLPSEIWQWIRVSDNMHAST